MLRSVAALLVAFLFMAATVMVGTIVAGTAFVPGLAVRAFGAVVGGWLAGRIAGRAPLAHAVALAAIVAVVTLSVPAGEAIPLWRTVVIGGVVVGGVLLGGWLRMAASTGAGA